MTISSPGCYFRTHSEAVIANNQRKVFGIRQLHFDPASMRMHKCVTNCFVSNPVNLISDEGIHLDRRAANDQKSLRNAIRLTLIQSGLQSLGQLAIVDG